MKKIIGALFIAVFVAGTASFGWAWGSGSKIQGTINNVDKNAISINSFSNDGVNNQPADFQITNQTRFRGVDDFSELKQGDQVRIVYKESGGQKLATTIAKQAVPYQSRTRNQAEGY
jgi:hypothetical protein